MTDALAPYACHAEHSRGRLHAETESLSRSPFQRDRDRIIHSAAFRRLEYKTQVFVNHEGDHYRTRLTHSLEVSQLARSICRTLRLNEDLAEALALAHDLGHTPFGHAGEDALDACMRPYGGFDHNAHTLRILTSLEQRYAEFDGLNLTWETLEGVAKHNGPLLGVEGRGEGGELPSSPSPLYPLPSALAAYNARHDLHLHTHPSLEAQIASLADDIAYNNHDIDDGLRAGLFGVGDLDAVPEVAAIFHQVQALYPGLAEPRLIHESIRRLINRMVSDLVATTRERLAQSAVADAEAVRHLGYPLVCFSEDMQKLNQELKAFLHARMYRHAKVNRMSSKARRVLRELFAFFHAEPECLPQSWRALTDAPSTPQTAATVSDYLAGMTDRYALDEHRRIFDVNARSW